MPTTEAGRALLHAIVDPRLDEPILRSVDAIEAEARAEGYAAGLAAAREAVAGLPYAPMRYSYIGDPVEHRLDHMERDAALAAIDALSDPSGHVGPADLHDPRSEEQGA